MNDAKPPSIFSRDGAKNLNELFPLIDAYYSPKVIGEVNDVYIKLAKVKGSEVP